jgi:hypothetical protein
MPKVLRDAMSNNAMPDTVSGRCWIKVGEDPLRYEYGRKNDSPGAPTIQDQLAYVEEEKCSSYFHWETYRSHKKGARPSREEAQAAATEVLKEEGHI